MAKIRHISLHSRFELQHRADRGAGRAARLTAQIGAPTL